MSVGNPSHCGRFVVAFVLIIYTTSMSRLEWHFKQVLWRWLAVEGPVGSLVRSCPTRSELAIEPNHTLSTGARFFRGAIVP